MKKLILIPIAAAVAIMAFAGEYPPGLRGNVDEVTILSATTNQTGNPVFVQKPVYHTFQLINATIRTNTITLERSLDSSN